MGVHRTRSHAELATVQAISAPTHGEQPPEVR